MALKIIELPNESDYRIAVEPNQYVLQKSREVKGETVWESIKFYGTLDGCLYRYSLIKLNETGDKHVTLRKYIEQWGIISHELATAIGSAMPISVFKGSIAPSE